MRYQYEAVDTLGAAAKGTLMALSPEDARIKLRRDGLTVRNLDVDNDDGHLLPRRVKKSEIICLTSQLSIMVDTGISLAAALDGIAEQEENSTLRKILVDLRERVESGESFSSALSKYSKQFDETFVALIRASEETGSMAQMLDRIAGYMQAELETRGKVRAALTYPGVMLFLAVGITIFLLTFIMPKFEPLFAKKGTSLPTTTVYLMALSDCMSDYWWAWLIGATALVVGFVFANRTPQGRQLLDWLKINMPIVGPMNRKVTISRSIRTLGTMVSSGVPMLDAIQLSSQVASNYYYQQVWSHVVDQVTQGSRICEALAGNALFPRTLIQMIGSGEETGKLDEVLAKVSCHYDREVETSLKAATSLIEPLMITVMGVIVGTIGLSILLPIFSLSRGH